MKKRNKSYKLPSEQARNKDLERLLRSCRPSGAGSPVIAKIHAPVFQGQLKISERIIATIVADASPGHYHLMKQRAVDLARYMHYDEVRVQERIEDPLLAEAVRLGGVIVSFKRERK